MRRGFPPSIRLLSALETVALQRTMGQEQMEKVTRSAEWRQIGSAKCGNVCKIEAIKVDLLQLLLHVF